MAISQYLIIYFSFVYAMRIILFECVCVADKPPSYAHLLRHTDYGAIFMHMPYLSDIFLSIYV